MRIKVSTIQKMSEVCKDEEGENCDQKKENHNLQVYENSIMLLTEMKILKRIQSGQSCGPTDHTIRFEWRIQNIQNIYAAFLIAFIEIFYS